MPRTPPPPGHVNMQGALDHLHRRGLTIGQSMFYKHVGKGRIPVHGPRKHKYYAIRDLDAFADEELIQPQGREARFAYAQLEDMTGVFAIASKLFASVVPISVETRRSWMTKEPRGHYVVKRLDGSIVAYVHFLALPDALIERYMRGEIYGKQITGEDILRLEPGRPVSCIIPSIATDPAIEPESLRSHYMGVLFRGLHNDLAELGRQGIIIPKIYAWTEWNSGIELCAKMGMQPWSPPVKAPGSARRYNYWLDVLSSPIPLLQGYQQALTEWQATHAPQRATMPIAPLTSPVVYDAPKRPPRILREPQPQDVPSELPPGTLTLQQFADELGIARRTLLELTTRHRFEHIALSSNRPDEMKRYFTLEQQQAVRAWREQHARR